MYPKCSWRIPPLEPNDTQGDDSDVCSTHSTPTCSTERVGEKGGCEGGWGNIGGSSGTIPAVMYRVTHHIVS